MADEFSRHMEQVALAVLPEFFEINLHMSTATEQRWRKHGSLSVDLTKGTFYDHEDQTGGGVLDLLKTYRGLSKREAVQWMQDQGFVQANGHVQGEKFAGFLDEWPIATYDYLDPEGRFAYQILKFPKTARQRFMQRRRAPDGGWIWGLRAGLYGKTRGGDWFKAKLGKKYTAEQHFAEAPHYLYRRDEVLAAIKAKRTVFLCEGEKDAETVRGWGFTATTNQGGAKNWHPDLTPDLKGADVVVLLDNDPAGRQRIVVRGAELSSVAKRVRVLDIAEHWPECPEKGDVTDWKERAGGDAAQFTALVKEAPRWTPTRPEDDYGTMTWSDMKSRQSELDYLVDGWLTTLGISIVGGVSRSGKSFLAIHTAMCVARGLPWFGYPVKKGGVLYQAGEGGLGVTKRFEAYRTYFEVPEDEDVPILSMPKKVNLYARDGDTEKLINTVKAWKIWMKASTGVELALVVFDTLATATPGASENDGKDMGQVLDNIAKIRDQCGVAVMLVHHMNAGGEKLRGWTGIYANVDQVILVTRDDDTNVKTALLDKQKDDEDGISVSFKLHVVPVSSAKRLDPTKQSTSCIVLTVSEKDQLEKEKERQGFVTSPSQYRVLTHLFNTIDRHGRLVTHGEQPQEALGKVVVDWKAFIDVAYEATPPGKTKEQLADALAKTFERKEIMSLLKGGVLGFKKPYLWWAGRPVKDFARTFPKSDISPTNPRQTPDNPSSPAVAELLESDWEIEI